MCAMCLSFAALLTLFTAGFGELDCDGLRTYKLVYQSVAIFLSPLFRDQHSHSKSNVSWNAYISFPTALAPSGWRCYRYKREDVHDMEVRLGASAEFVEG
ncbi:uncharacterized protein EDB91DRAFT_1149479 [Suillus paluster]|uniref:uncharacterized protein n=1 Tax=Suillus paluster TaxID=48578 RepID=UPI001B86297A|nr:uncharacterized protein EDB91DRAFT_1149479 [Suillus paluster]KAG1733212.1 hypothetical protein EDB91DRAFT_1149479 [Suillus paluster]